MQWYEGAHFPSLPDFNVLVGRVVEPCIAVMNRGQGLVDSALTSLVHSVIPREFKSHEEQLGW